MSSLKSFVAPPSLRLLANGAFYFCRSLRYVELNEGLETIGTDRGTYGVFGDSALEHVLLPSTLKWTESKAFSGCTSLTSVKSREAPV